jgi:hypothetical protein
MKKLCVLVACIIVSINIVSAQKFKPVPDFLKGETKVNVLFDYNGVTFDGDSQKEYYEYKGDSWVEEWEGVRRTGNASAFIGDINDELKGIKMNVGNYPDAKYTIIVDVLDCDFGAYAGPMSVPAKLKCTIRIVKTGTTETLASITLKEAQNSATVIGTAVDFDRMYLAFGEMGEEIGEKLVKILK